VDIGEVQALASDVSSKITELHNIAPGIKNTLDDIHSTLKYLKLDQNNFPSVRSSSSIKHYHVPNGRLVHDFVGRNAILKKIETIFSIGRGCGQRIAVLRGIGGQGKTQIALEYCRRAKEKGVGAIFWVDATSEDTVKKSFQTVTERIKDHEEFVPENEVVDYILERFREWPDPWLMVFDNYDDAKTFDNIRDFIPEGDAGCILVTSRHTASDYLVGDLDSAIELEGLSSEEALDLLWKTSRIQARQIKTGISEARRIVQRLAYHPLAITQAGSYIRQQKIRMDQFMSHYDAKRERILKHTPQISQYRRRLSSSAERETSLNVFTTWELSFQQLVDTADSGKEKADLLTLFAFFDYKDISEELFSAYCKQAQVFDHYSWPVQCLIPCLGAFYPDGQILSGHNPTKRNLDGQRQWDSDLFVEIINDLAQTSLVQSWSRGEDDFCHFSLHPLVKDWIRLRTSEEIRQYCAVISGKILMAFLLQNYYQKSFNLSLSSQYTVLSHIEVYVESTAILTSTAALSLYLQEERLDLVDDWMGSFLVRCGRYKEAEVMRKRLVDSREKTLGSEHASTLQAMSHLANAYDLQEKFDLAEELHRKTLKARQTLLGPDHPKTFRTMGDIAWVLYQKGNYAAAEEIARAAVEGQDKALGPDNQTSFNSFDTLAQILRAQGKYQEAEKVQRRSLVGREKVLGVDHPATLIAAINVGSILQSQGRLDCAEELMKSALERQEKILGRHHPDTLLCTNNLALVFRDQGRLEVAEEIMRGVIELNKKLLGQSHSFTLKSTAGLARILRDRKQYEDALALYQQTILRLRKVLGPDHPYNIKLSKEFEGLQKEMGTEV
jgi:tetratricopeptide (TPR) repeat protein